MKGETYMHRSKSTTVNCLTCSYWEGDVTESSTAKGDLLCVSKNTYSLCCNCNSSRYKQRRSYKQHCVNHNSRKTNKHN